MYIDHVLHSKLAWKWSFRSSTISGPTFFAWTVLPRDRRRNMWLGRNLPLECCTGQKVLYGGDSNTGLSSFWTKVSHLLMESSDLFVFVFVVKNQVWVGRRWARGLSKVFESWSCSWNCRVFSLLSDIPISIPCSFGKTGDKYGHVGKLPLNLDVPYLEL
jgi:hypothetical protein